MAAPERLYEEYSQWTLGLGNEKSKLVKILPKGAVHRGPPQPGLNKRISFFYDGNFLMIQPEEIPKRIDLVELRILRDVSSDLKPGREHRYRPSSFWYHRDLEVMVKEQMAKDGLTYQHLLELQLDRLRRSQDPNPSLPYWVQIGAIDLRSVTFLTRLATLALVWEKPGAEKFIQISGKFPPGKIERSLAPISSQEVINLLSHFVGENRIVLSNFSRQYTAARKILLRSLKLETS